MRNVCPSTTVPAGRTAPRDMLFKPDRPRPIDRYIDYFGDAGARQWSQDVLDDVLLETSA